MAPNYRRIVAEQEERIKALEGLILTHEDLERAMNDKISILHKQIDEKDALIQKLSEICKEQQEILNHVAEGINKPAEEEKKTDVE